MRLLEASWPDGHRIRVAGRGPHGAHLDRGIVTAGPADRSGVAARGEHWPVRRHHLFLVLEVELVALDILDVVVVVVGVVDVVVVVVGVVVLVVVVVLSLLVVVFVCVFVVVVDLGAEI
ncbi:MAG: hypothetical protein VW396_06490, partial [Ilumatobacter sp.]